MDERDQITVSVSGLTVQSRGYVVLRPAEMTDGEHGWMAEDLRRPGCVGYGPTEEQARESLTRAAQAYDLSGDVQPEGEDPDLFASGHSGYPEAHSPWTRSIDPTGAELTV